MFCITFQDSFTGQQIASGYASSLPDALSNLKEKIIETRDRTNDSIRRSHATLQGYAKILKELDNL